MTIKRESIVAAMVTAIKNANTPAGSRVYRDRPVLDSFTRDTLPQINVAKMSDAPTQEVFGGPLDWKMVVAIKVAAIGTDPDSQVEATIGALHAALFADRTFGGLAFDTAAGSISFEYPPEHMEACVATCEYAVRYRTTETTL